MNIENMISSMGFPIVCCIAMAIFIYKTMTNKICIDLETVKNLIKEWQSFIVALNNNTAAVNQICELLLEETNKERQECEEEEYGD